MYIKLKEINEQKREQAFNSQQEYNEWARKQYIKIERLAKLWLKY